MKQQMQALSRMRWIPGLNITEGEDAEEIPPFACVYPYSADANGIIGVVQHATDNCPLFAFNGPLPVPVGGYGEFTFFGPCHAIYETGYGTPVNGQDWGSLSDSWKIAPGAGVKILGGVTNGRVFVVSSNTDRFLAKLTRKTFITGEFTAYEWKMVTDSDDPVPITYTEKYTSDWPAYDIRNVDHPVPIIVELQQGYGAYYLIVDQPRNEIVRKTSSTPSGGYYTGFLQRWDQTNLVWVDTDAILIRDANA